MAIFRAGQVFEFDSSQLVAAIDEAIGTAWRTKTIVQTINATSRGRDAGDPIIYPAGPGVTLNPNFTVRVNGQESPVYPVRVNAARRSGQSANSPIYETAGFTSFDITGLVRVAITVPDRVVTTARIYPSSYNVQPAVIDGVIYVNVPHPGKYEVCINGSEERPIYLFVNPPQTSIPQPGPNTIVYEPGVHNIGTVNIQSNQTYYIAGGAVVTGRFIATDVNNFTIKGRGVLTNTSNLFLFTRCANFLLEGITCVRNGAGDWTLKPFRCHDYLVEWMNAFTDTVTGDGFDSVSCYNYEMRHLFTRTTDDPLCINSYDGLGGDITNVYIHDCVLMSDSCVGMLEIGASLECEKISNVKYENIDICHPYAHTGISIYNADYALVKDITYNNIRIEDFKGTETNSAFFRFHCTNSGFSKQPYTGGNIQNVLVNNVTFTGGNQTYRRAYITGYDVTHRVSGIVFNNLVINGTKITGTGTGTDKLTLITNAFADTLIFN